MKGNVVFEKNTFPWQKVIAKIVLERNGEVSFEIFHEAACHEVIQLIICKRFVPEAGAIIYCQTTCGVPFVRQHSYLEACNCLPFY